MKKISFSFGSILIFFLLFCCNGQSQFPYKEIKGKAGDEVFLHIGNKKITKEQFKIGMVTKIHDKKITFDDAYLQLYIDFQLKVKDAEDKEMDQTVAFKTELNGYANQLKKKYARSIQNIEPLVLEAYERKKHSLKVAHILITVTEKATPEDTVTALNKILDIRREITGGLDFLEAAKLYSEDPSAKTNNRELGYFSAFDMVYPFECAAYSLKQDEVSLPVRTRFGYHLIFLMEKIVNPGEVLVKHIMLKATDEQSLKTAFEKIKEIKKEFNRGESFENLVATYSDDKASQKNKGELAWFGPGKMPAVEFEKAAFNLSKVGDVSEPVQTKYGWHLIQLVNKRGLPSYAEMKTSLTEKVQKDERAKVISAIPEEIIETNPNYNSELTEYRDGILLFNLTDQNVWSKAVKDTEGLKAFYEENKNAYGDFQTSKGKITADYQKFLEKEWLEKLRKKYQVTLNKTVFNELLAELQ